MDQLLRDACEATGLTERQIFHEARFAFVGLKNETIRLTATRIYDEYIGTNRLPDYVEGWCIGKINAHREVKQRATKKSASRIGPTDHLQPSGNGEVMKA